MKILIVDDSIPFLNALEVILREAGYMNIVVKQSAPEAIEYLLSSNCREPGSHVDIILMDVIMPGMDGLETLIRIRGIRPDVPVLVCSGFGDVEVEARFAGKAIAGFFPKPYTVKQLARKVKECIAPATGSAGG